VIRMPYSPSIVTLLASLAAALLAATAHAQPPGGDPIHERMGAEIDRWDAYVQSHPDSGELWGDIRESVEPVLQRTEQAARDGYRYLALSRLMVAYPSLAAASFMDGYTQEQLRDSTAFRGVWRDNEAVLLADLDPVNPSEFDRIRPAALRAAAEISLPQVREYYYASGDYERATIPASGYFYLGYARAQRDFTALCRTWTEDAGRLPTLRSLAVEIDSLEDEVLRAYRPPLSIERHGEFVLVGSYLKEARELTAMGLHEGALLRYLQAALRFAPVRAAAHGDPTEPEARRRLEELRPRLLAANEDHTIGRIFLELAESELATTPSDSVPPLAGAAVFDVLPRYLAAIGPVPADRSRPVPRVTVTLVRWPYT
jgi:hypothetical protein